MNVLNKLDKKKKTVLIVSMITLLILGIISATVAFFGWVGEESSISVTVLGEGSCSLKGDNEVFLEPTETRDNGRIIKFSARQSLATEAYVVWTMRVNKTNGLNDATFRYEMINTTTGASYGSGNFADVIDGSFIRFSNENEVLEISKEYEFTLYLWIDGTIGNNPVSMAGQELDFDMNCLITDQLGNVSTGTTFIDLITNLYSANYDSSKDVAFADGEGMNYYAPDARLMNDGLDINGNMVSSDKAIKGTAGNIRYYGADDEDLRNHIYFNCSDYSNQSSETCETWRIIGIVDGKVKLIRNESIGEYQFDRRNAYCDASETNCYDLTTNEKLDSSLEKQYVGTVEGQYRYYYGLNDWSEASLMKMLNDGGTYYSQLKNKNSKTLDLISSSTWYINGLPNNEEVNLNYYDYYKIERTGESKWEGNIALPYPSDFAYARDLNVTGDSELLISSNWLATNSEIVDWAEEMDKIYHYWFISPFQGYLDAVYVNDWGDIYWYSVVCEKDEVRPTLYLEPELLVKSGNGTSDNPYQIYVEEENTLINYITDLYTSGNPTLITHSKDDGTSDTYYYSYQDNTDTWGLMNDGLKVSSTSGVGATTITDTTKLTSGTEGNIRYFGPSDSVNNYIYFNCKTYPDTNCELWRIIGIVDGKVKLIRNESIGTYSWDNKNTTTGATTAYGSNDWSDARLMRLLNPGYEDYVDKDNSGNDLVANNSLYWNGESGTCYAGQNNATKTCDFTSTGLKNDNTRDMISESTWYLGGYNSSSIYPNDIYNYERTNTVGTTIYSDNPYTITANVGLMYPSDYGYATNLSICGATLYDYDDDTTPGCASNNWLYNGVWQWLIAPDSSDSGIAWYVYSPGNVSSYYVYNARGVSPVLYLDSELVVVSGEGTSSNPYRISAS